MQTNISAGFNGSYIPSVHVVKVPFYKPDPGMACAHRQPAFCKNQTISKYSALCAYVKFIKIAHYTKISFFSKPSSMPGHQKSPPGANHDLQKTIRMAQPGC